MANCLCSSGVISLERAGLFIEGVGDGFNDGEGAGGGGIDTMSISAISASAAIPFALNSSWFSSSLCRAYFLLLLTPISGNINGVVALFEGAKLCTG